MMGDDMFGWRIFHVYSAGGLASALQINSYCSKVARSSVFFGVVIFIFRGFHLTLTKEKRFKKVHSPKCPINIVNEGPVQLTL